MQNIDKKLLIALIILFVELYLVINLTESTYRILVLVATLITAFEIGKFQERKINSYSPPKTGEIGENTGEIEGS